MTKFSDLKLDPKVLKAISEAGYDSPTPIQAGAIPPALEGRDVLGIAQTGTGKTASFTLPMITLLGRGRARARMPRSLVLAPTRELAAQVAENFDTYAKHTRLTKALLIGGVSFGEQDKLIDRGVDVLIATPGRLLDHFERGKLLLTGVQIMVVDEADRMLDMGFIPDIERIFQLTPFTRQTLFFSATMAPEIERITDTFLHSPERIEVARQATTSETITQRLVEITPTRKDQTAKQKRELLRALIDAEGEALTNAIIFCNRKTDVDIVAKSLKAHGYDASPIHGDLDQRHRMATLDGFREGSLRFLIASDVAARGLDIPAVSHVFNFDLPSHAEDYVHRIGRTGRAGRQGTSISISTPMDEKYLAAIESLVKQTLPRAPIPEGFTLTSAAQDAPRAQSRNGRDGARGRDRDRGRDKGHDRGQDRSQDKGREHERRRGGRDQAASDNHIEQVAEHMTEQAVREPAPSRHAENRAVESRAAEQRTAEPRSSGTEQASPRTRQDHSQPRDNRAEPRQEHRDENRGDRNGDRRGRRDRSDRDRYTVLGMGEHVPDFMLRSFRTDSFAARPEQDDSRDERKPVEQDIAVIAEAPALDVATPEVAAEAAATAKAKPARKRAPRARKSAPAETAVTEAPASETAQAETALADAPVVAVVETAVEPVVETGTETAATETQPAEPAKKPARKRAPRSRKAEPAEPSADAAAPTDAEAEAAPVRKRAPRARKPKATPEATAADATPAADSSADSEA